MGSFEGWGGEDEGEQEGERKNKKKRFWFNSDCSFDRFAIYTFIATILLVLSPLSFVSMNKPLTSIGAMQEKKSPNLDMISRFRRHVLYMMLCIAHGNEGVENLKAVLIQPRHKQT